MNGTYSRPLIIEVDANTFFSSSVYPWALPDLAPAGSTAKGAGPVGVSRRLSPSNPNGGTNRVVVAVTGAAFVFVGADVVVCALKMPFNFSARSRACWATFVSLSAKSLSTVSLKGSISSMYYARFFRTKFWHQKFQYFVLGFIVLATNFRTKNAHEKCWWNWHLLGFDAQRDGLRVQFNGLIGVATFILV